MVDFSDFSFNSAVYLATLLKAYQYPSWRKKPLNWSERRGHFVRSDELTPPLPLKASLAGAAEAIYLKFYHKHRLMRNTKVRIEFEKRYLVTNTLFWSGFA